MSAAVGLSPLLCLKRVGWLVVVLLLVAGELWADIYMFIDSDGVLHFTNAPTTSQYTLYIKERPAPTPSTTRFDSIIQDASQKFDLSFSLLKAMIKVESNFDARAVSRKGAMGLMQIMPQNVEAFNIANPFNPEENIMGGARYLKTLIERFRGKLPLALAAYNAGPNTVEKYMDIPPIAETENYVEKVMKYFYLYNNT